MKGVIKGWQKLKYVVTHLPSYYAPNQLRRYNAEAALDKLSSEQRDYVFHRASLCNRLSDPFSLTPEAQCLNDLILKKHTAYKLDFARASMGFPRETRFEMQFGDVTKIPKRPTLLKTRPIAEGNENSVLLKLNTPRHYQFSKDPVAYADKSSTPVFRGLDHNLDRKRFLSQYANNTRVDFKASHRRGAALAHYLTPKQQMQHKFIVSLEGVDVASNLKWVMASNSLCLMKRPTMESWFLESQLIPGVHYIEINEDYSNIEEAIQPYLDDYGLAEEMIQAKQAYLAPYRNQKLEKLISHLVLEKYINLYE